MFLNFLKKYLIQVSAVLVLAFIIFHNITLEEKNYPSSFDDLSRATVMVASHTFNAWVASTEEERASGLSGTKGLLDDEAMLFVFEKPDVYGFWMKDMLIPIDIVWINGKNEVVHIEKNVLPETFPKVFFPQRPAIYVFETRGGFAEANNVKVGDKVSIEF